MNKFSTTPSAEAAATPPNQGGELFLSGSPDETFALGEKLGQTLREGDIVLLYGGLGAGKTLLTKGILDALDYDVNEVTSPSFTLVNLYKTSTFDVYHIDLWRLDGNQDAALAVGLDEIIEKDNVVTIIEWADRLSDVAFTERMIVVQVEGDGFEPRKIEIQHPRRAEAIVE
jgi:tRNA threonylcarbamoyladenosine biosynthesis protein TsaE